MSVEITTTSTTIELSEQELDAVAGGTIFRVICPGGQPPRPPVDRPGRPSFPNFPGLTPITKKPLPSRPLDSRIFV